MNKQRYLYIHYIVSFIWPFIAGWCFDCYVDELAWWAILFLYMIGFTLGRWYEDSDE